MNSQNLPSKNEMSEQRKSQDGPPWESFVPITCIVGNAGFITKDDGYFFTELRILSGKLRGDLVKQNWSRQWKSGDWKEDTIEMLRCLCPVEDQKGAPVWSYMLVNKCFTMTPVQNKKGFWSYKDFEVAEVPPEDQAEFQQQQRATTQQDNDIPF